jgi:phosphatidylserine/phosphatidylglycerophosphate/cardiolipin synthase-like enzyme
MPSSASNWPGAGAADEPGYLLAGLATYPGCRITPLLDGAAYTAALAEALDRVGGPAAPGGQLILVAGWWLGLAGGTLGPPPGLLRPGRPPLAAGPPFSLQPLPERPGADTALLDLLRAKARAGVDVRVLGWVSAAARHRRLAGLLGAGGIAGINQLTMRSVRELRAEPAIGGKALLNTVAHTLGSCHSKLVLVCDGRDTVAFTGGLDLAPGRWARPEHPGAEVWHDVAARLQGPVVHSVYDHFRAMWAENLARPAARYRLDGTRLASRLPDSPALPVRALPIAPTGSRHRAQGLQTFPAARYRRIRIAPRSRPVGAAPDGLFTYRTALRTAIGAARRYVYLEDQLHWSPEVMGWLNEALRRQPALRVILLRSGLADPNDPPLPHPAYRAAAASRLLAGLDQPQRRRVAAFARAGIVVHAKTVLVDDVWAAIGSANLAQRSLYTDIEHGVSIVDDDGELVRRYRGRLWAHHFKHPEPADFEPLPAGLHAWCPGWGAPGRAPSRPGWLHPVPLAPAPLGRRLRWIRAAFHDCDSRVPWSGLPG